MRMAFFDSLKSEWLKKRRSLAGWIVIAGGFFTPVIVIAARIIYGHDLPKIYASPKFWNQLWISSWESMALFLLPLGAILTTSLLTQLEYKNNTWKQIYASPQTLTTIFFSKLLVIMIMMLQFFVLFNIGIYLSALIPFLVTPDVPYPLQPLPISYFLTQDLYFFIDCLPIVALQYLISLNHRNFLVPVGIGFILWIGALSALQFKYNYLVPYTYGMLNYLKEGVKSKAFLPELNIHFFALGYFVLITGVSYVLAVTKKVRA